MFFYVYVIFNATTQKFINYIYFGVFEIRLYYCLRRWLRTLAIDACAMALKTLTAGYRHPCLTNDVAR